MIDKDQVLQLVRTKGYVVPSDLTRDFRSDTFIIGAVLSDLVHDKKLGVTSVKIGGSPVYYAPEQKEKLQDLSKYLNEKDKGTFALLQQQKVISDAEQSPLLRVSLRTLKDYAKPIEVTTNSQTFLFWKWYLATEQEVTTALHSYFSKISLQQTNTLPLQSAPPITSSEVPLSSQVQPSSEKALLKKPKQKKIVQQPLVAPPTETPAVFIPADDSFAQRVATFFHTKNMKILQFSVLKKGEIDCVVLVPSPVGTIQYYCKAKNKKKCTEGEVATAFVAGQMKKLPALLLAPAEFPKKLLSSIDKDYPNMKLLPMGDERDE